MQRMMWTRGWLTFGRAWKQSAAVFLLGLAAITVLAAIAMSILSGLASVQRDLLLDADGEVSASGLVLLAFEVAVPFVMAGFLVSAITLVALAKLSDDVLKGEEPRVFPAISRGIRRVPWFVAGTAIAGLAVGGLVLLTPLFVAVGVLGLLATPIFRLAARRWPAISCPPVRTLGLLAIPLAPAAAAAVGWGLVLPVAALERTGIRQTLDRSRTLVGRGWSGPATVLIGLFFFYFIVSTGVNLLGAGGVPVIVVAGVVLIVQFVVTSLPVATATTLFRHLVPMSPDSLVLTDPEPTERPAVPNVAFMVAFAAIAVGGVIYQAPAALAAPTQSFTVTVLGDSPDAISDGVCEATVGAGDCSLRAAIDEANASPAEITGITFAVSGTINLDSTLVVNTAVEIDGSGRQVEVSGQGVAQIMQFTTSSSFLVANLGFTGGAGGVGSAIEAAPGSFSMLMNVTFSANSSSAAGAAVAVMGGEVLLGNATFHSNVGADLMGDTAAGGISVFYSTFANGSGGSAAVQHRSGYLTLDSSIVAPSTGQACSGAVISGGSNLDTDSTCPGSSPVGVLGSFGYASPPGSVKTVAIGFESGAVDLGNGESCAQVSFRDARGEARAACDIGAYEFDGRLVEPNVSVTTSPSPTELGQTVAVAVTVTSPNGVLFGEGTVSFTQDGAPVATDVPLVGGGARVDVTGLAVGEYVFAVAFSGDTRFNPGSGSTTHTVSAPVTAVAVTVSPETSQIGQPVTIDATVTTGDAIGVPTGTVTFRDGPTEIGTAELDAGSAQLIVSSLSAGDRTIFVDYGGDGTFPPSTGEAALRVQSPASVELMQSAATSVSGEAVTFAAVVIPDDPTVTPVGDVSLTIDAVEVGRATPGASGRVEFEFSDLAVGERTVVARYEGDAIVLGGDSSRLVHTVGRADTTARLVTTPNPSVLGDPVTFTASIRVVAPGAGTLTGNVVFSTTTADGPVELATVALDASANASLTTNSLPEGSNEIVASYSGDVGFGPASSTVVQTVAAATTQVTLTSSANPAAIGESVTFTADVSALDGDPGTPTGSVRFLRDGIEAAVVVLDASGAAVLTLDDLATGSTQLTAEYLGTADFAPSSTVLDQSVSQIETTVDVQSSLTSVVTGEVITFTATVTPTIATALVPTGSVTFSGFGQSVSEPLDPATGTASVTLPAPALGGTSRLVSATYEGNAEFVLSRGNADIRVDPGRVDVVVTATHDSVVVGQPVTVTVTVTPVAPSTGVPVGNLVIEDFGDTPLQSTTGQITTFTTTFLTPQDLGPASHRLSATFEGQGWITSASPTVPVLVAPVPAEVTLAVSPSPSTRGEELTLTATVTVPDGAIAPTGQRIFFVDGNTDLGQAAVQFVGGEYVATFRTSALEVGLHTLSAVLQGENFETSTSPPVDHIVLDRATEVTISTNGPTDAGDPVVVTVTVVALGQGGQPAPTGTVDLFLDGSLRRAPVTLTNNGLSAFASFTLDEPIAVGTRELSSTYVPSGDFAPATGTARHIVLGRVLDLQISTDVRDVVWGATVQVTATWTALPTAPQPSGFIIVSDESGPLCRFTPSTSGCSVSWPEPGTKTLRASFAGDTAYGPVTSREQSVRVSRRQANLQVDFDSTGVVTGEPFTVRWSMPDTPGVTGPVTATVGGTGCTGGSSGACTGTFPLSAASRQQQVQVRFIGDQLYEPTASIGQVTPTGCYRLQLLFFPSSDGFLQTSPGPQCNGDGYLAGTRVSVSGVLNAENDPSYDLDGIDWNNDGVVDAPSITVVVGPDSRAGQTQSVTGRSVRGFNCYTLFWAFTETVPNGINDRGGSILVEQDPNCPTDAQGRSEPDPQFETVDGIQIGRYLAGTVIDVTAVAESRMDFYGFELGSERLVMNEDRNLKGVFGPACFELDLVAPEGATIETTSAPSCQNPLTGFVGYGIDSEIEVVATAAPGTYVRSWLGADWVNSDDRARYCGAGGCLLPDDRLDKDALLGSGGRTPTWTGAVVVGGSDGVTSTISPVIDVCTRITSVVREWADSVGSVTRSRSGDCPTSTNPNDYKRGGTVRFDRELLLGEFGRWGFPDDADELANRGSSSVEVSTDEDLALRPTFHPGCVDLTLRVAEGMPGAVSFNAPQARDAFCLTGELADGPARELSGQYFAPLGNPTLESSGTTGTALYGWKFVLPDRTLSTAGARFEGLPALRGDVVAEFSQCGAISPLVELVYPSGETELAGAPKGFVQLDDAATGAPDCAFGNNTWNVGSSTVLSPLDSDAFIFTGWKGDVAPPSPNSRTLPVDFDGSVPVIEVIAVYEVVCYDVEVKNTRGVEFSEQPNCQPSDSAAPDGPSGSFIADTDLFVIGELPGGKVPTDDSRQGADHVWTGWKGDIDEDAEFLNPVSITITEDTLVDFSFRKKNSGERAEDVGEDVAAVASETVRKGMGFVALGMGEFLLNNGPLGLMGIAIAGVGVLNDVLGEIGLKIDGIDDFARWSAETNAWLSSQYTCIGRWALDDGGRSEVVDPSGSQNESNVDKVGIGVAVTGELAGQASSRLQTYDSYLEYDQTKANTKAVGRAADRAGKALQVAKVGVDIYELARADGINWNNDPKAAWTDNEALFQCLEDALPNYMGLPPEAPCDPEDATIENCDG